MQITERTEIRGKIFILQMFARVCKLNFELDFHMQMSAATLTYTFIDKNIKIQ